MQGTALVRIPTTRPRKVRIIKITRIRRTKRTQTETRVVIENSIARTNRAYKKTVIANSEQI